MIFGVEMLSKMKRKPINGEKIPTNKISCDVFKRIQKKCYPKKINKKVQVSTFAFKFLFFFVTGSQKCATCMNRKEDIKKLVSHCMQQMLWELLQCTKHLDPSSTPWTVWHWMSLVRLCWCHLLIKVLENCWIGPSFLNTYVFVSLGTTGVKCRGALIMLW